MGVLESTCSKECWYILDTAKVNKTLSNYMPKEFYLLCGIDKNGKRKFSRLRDFSDNRAAFNFN